MKLFLAIFALVVLSFGVYIYADIATQPASVIVTTFPEEPENEKVVVVTRTNRGYEPAELAIDKGTTVLWRNESGQFHWPASNEHPSHEAYPSFDPKRPLAPGEDWRFTFENPGEWAYHDHIKANIGGSIFVEDPDEGSFDLMEGQISDTEFVKDLEN